MKTNLRILARVSEPGYPPVFQLTTTEKLRWWCTSEALADRERWRAWRRLDPGRPQYANQLDRRERCAWLLQSWCLHTLDDLSLTQAREWRRQLRDQRSDPERSPWHGTMAAGLDLVLAAADRELARRRFAGSPDGSGLTYRLGDKL